MRIRVRHLGVVSSRTQEHYSGHIRIDPTREGEAALRRPGGSLELWDGTNLEEYLRTTRQLALRYGESDDGWSSSLVLRWRCEGSGVYLIATEHSRYVVEKI